ncbi:Protein of unknown function [Bacillus mycoides]|nr:Protein of unknown function [Bacillus mycoides]
MFRLHLKGVKMVGKIGGIYWKILS